MACGLSAVREALIVANLEEIIDGEDFILLYDTFSSKPVFRSHIGNFKVSMRIHGAIYPGSRLVSWSPYVPKHRATKKPPLAGQEQYGVSKRIAVRERGPSFVV